MLAVGRVFFFFFFFFKTTSLTWDWSPVVLIGVKVAGIRSGKTGVGPFPPKNVQSGHRFRSICSLSSQ